MEEFFSLKLILRVYIGTKLFFLFNPSPKSETKTFTGTLTVTINTEIRRWFVKTNETGDDRGVDRP